MTVGLKVSSVVFEIGPSSILMAFFSSIHCNLEDGAWGSEYPMLLKALYSGRLPFKDASAALEELSAVESFFKKIKPEKVVWDFEDLEQLRPEGFPSEESANNLSEIFVTKKGMPLIPLIESRLNLAIKTKRDITIDTSHFKFLHKKG